METLYAISALEVMAWCLFFKKTALVHAAALLIFVKILFPIIKSVLLHVCYRIPVALYHRRCWATFRAHCVIMFAFARDKYKAAYGKSTAKGRVIPKEPSKKELPQPVRAWWEMEPQNPGYVPVGRTDFLGNPIDPEDAIVAANMKKIDKEIDAFLRGEL